MFVYTKYDYSKICGKKIGFRLIQFLIGVFQGSAEKSNNSEILEVN